MKAQFSSNHPANTAPVSSVDAIKFQSNGKRFTKLSFWMVIGSALLFALSAILVRSVTAAPEAIILFSVFYLYYHVFHAFIALFRVFKYLFVIRKNNLGVTIGGTFIALILTPISAGFAYLASVFLLLSSCAA